MSLPSAPDNISESGNTPAYLLLTVTISMAALTFWFVMGPSGKQILRPAYTALAAGITGALVFQAWSAPWPLGSNPMYLWLRSAVGGGGAALGVFGLASLAFAGPDLAGSPSYNFVGLGLLGLVAGLVSATASRNTMDVGVGRTPFSTVSEQFDAKARSITATIQPQINDLIASVLGGPELPSYSGFAAISIKAQYPSPLDTARRRETVLVHFDSIKPSTQFEQSTESRVLPVVIRNRRSSQQSGEAPGPTSFDLQVLFHDPGLPDSPQSQTLTVPLEGQSRAIQFHSQPAVSSTMARLLELRCQGVLIQIVALDAGRSL